MIAGKRRIFKAYRDGLADLHGISMNPEPAGTQNGFWMPTVVFSRDRKVTREMLQTAFALGNADARVFFWPLSSTSPFDLGSGLPVARDIAARAINLPAYHDITDEELQRVVSILRDLP